MMESRPPVTVKRTELHGILVYAREGLDLTEVEEGLRYVTDVSSTVRDSMRMPHLGLFINMMNDFGVATIFRRDAVPEIDKTPNAKAAATAIFELGKSGRAFMALGKKTHKPLWSAVVGLLDLFEYGLPPTLR